MDFLLDPLGKSLLDSFAPCSHVPNVVKALSGPKAAAEEGKDYRSPQILGISRDFYGFLWISNDFCGFLGISKDF